MKSALLHRQCKSISHTFPCYPGDGTEQSAQHKPAGCDVFSWGAKTFSPPWHWSTAFCYSSQGKKIYEKKTQLKRISEPLFPPCSQNKSNCLTKGSAKEWQGTCAGSQQERGFWLYTLPSPALCTHTLVQKLLWWLRPLLRTSPWMGALSASDGGNASTRQEGGVHSTGASVEAPDIWSLYSSLWRHERFPHLLPSSYCVRGLRPALGTAAASKLPPSLRGPHKGPRPYPLTESPPSSIRRVQCARRGDGYLGSGF